MTTDQGCVALTIPELAEILDPPLSEAQLRSIVSLMRLEPVDVRRTGARGRPRPAYDARMIMQLHAMLAPYLDRARITAA